MERRNRAAEAENLDYINLSLVIELVTDEAFVEAVRALDEATDQHTQTAAEQATEVAQEQLAVTVSELADTFAELAEKHNASTYVMQTAIKMLREDQAELAE